MPNRLSKLFSSSETKEKEALAEAERNRSSQSESPPPGYSEDAPDYDQDNILDPPDITAGFKNLNISADSRNSFPQPEETIAHLKVLECFYRLKQSVGSYDKLFGISNGAVTRHGLPETDKTAEALSKLAEKRWAIYLQRAVDRFEQWRAAVTPDAHMITRKNLELLGSDGSLLEESYTDGQQRLKFDKTNMPPVDVLMVWHAYMLNPRVSATIRLKRRPLLTRIIELPRRLHQRRENASLAHAYALASRLRMHQPRVFRVRSDARSTTIFH